MKIQVTKRCLTEREAATYCGMSIRFLRQARCYPGVGTPGPVHTKIGRSVRYTLEDLDQWIDAHRKPGVPLDAARPTTSRPTYHAVREGG